MRPGEVTDLSNLPVILSVPEVAKILRLSKSQAYAYIQPCHLCHLPAMPVIAQHGPPGRL